MIYLFAYTLNTISVTKRRACMLCARAFLLLYTWLPLIGSPVTVILPFAQYFNSHSDFTHIRNVYPIFSLYLQLHTLLA